MIDTSVVRVHQHGACIADNNHADRGYDADWIREMARQQGAWANIQPKRNRKAPICFSPYLYRARNLIERLFNKIKQCGRWWRGP